MLGSAPCPTRPTDSRLNPGILEVTMASGLCGVVVLALCVSLAPCVSAGSKDCDSYTDASGFYKAPQKCRTGFCCGDCFDRNCCHDTFRRFTEDQQEDCTYRFATYNSPMPLVVGISLCVSVVLIMICCCVCPCCCLYKMCRKPRPVIATTTQTTVVTTAPQHYPQQPTATPGHSYQGGQYPPYQPVPVQPGYGAQPMPQAYGAQPAAPSPYHGQPFGAGPPPTYQEATGPAYPPNPMPYSQAAFTPGHAPYPLQPPAQSSAPPARPDYLAQPAYNPDYVAP